MKTIKNNLKSEAVYDDNETRRYSLHLEWQKDLKKACVIMLKAGKTNGVFFDRTTNFVLENLASLDFGSVDILNLFSALNGGFDDADNDNLKAIESACKSADVVIFAVGTGHKMNKKVITRQKEVIAILKNHSDKLLCIADDEGQKFYHPLCPKVQKWNLVNFDVKEIDESD